MGWIGSIYFDQNNWELYKKRLLRSDSSMLFRWRWYSKKTPKKGFMEQKIRRPGWRGESIIKQRFDLAAEHCMKFIKGGHSALPEEYRGVNLPQEMFRDMANWGPEMFPKIRSVYRRTVFQEFNGAAVRVSFDEDVHLTAVDNFENGTNMDEHGLDEATNNSFVFPLGILEVKMAFDPNTRNPREVLRLPEWVESMMADGTITRVHKFSKYLTGVAMLHCDEITRVPAWLEACRSMIAVEMFKHGTEVLGSTDTYVVQIPQAKVVEPRTYMANERTFLKWSRMCFLAFFVGLGLFGAGIDPVTGIVLAVCSLLILFRAYYVYRERLKMIQSDKYREDFHDKLGPHLLMILFVVPTVVFIINQAIIERGRK